MDTNKKGLIGRIRSLGWGFAAMLFIAGVLFWGKGFNTAMEWSAVEVDTKTLNMEDTPEASLADEEQPAQGEDLTSVEIKNRRRIF